jgi:glycosyltransferase involved in cell wall biosynthesis
MMLLVRALSKGKPFISSQHATIWQERRVHNAYYRTVTQHALHGFDAFHVLNNEDLAQYKKWGLESVFMIPNGVDTQKFRPLSLSEAPKFTMLFVGRLDSQKGVDTLLDAIEFLEASNREVLDNSSIKVIGMGPLTDLAKAFARKRSYIDYLGYVTEEELIQSYQNASIMLMPSRRETFGLVALEAMACGLPLIAADIPGPQSFIRGDFGQLIRPSDSVALAAAIERFYEKWSTNPVEFNGMRNAARKKCVKEHDWELVVDRLATMIRSIHEETQTR